MDSAALVHRASFDERLPWLLGLHTPDEDRRYYREHVYAASTVWGAFAAGVLVGIIAIREGWIDQLYVLPSAQGRGIGTALLETAKLREKELSLWTFSETQARDDSMSAMASSRRGRLMASGMKSASRTRCAAGCGGADGALSAAEIRSTNTGTEFASSDSVRRRARRPWRCWAGWRRRGLARVVGRRQWALGVVALLGVVGVAGAVASLPRRSRRVRPACATAGWSWGATLHG